MTTSQNRTGAPENSEALMNTPTQIHAAMRADAMLEKGDLDGYAV